MFSQTVRFTLVSGTYKQWNHRYCRELTQESLQRWTRDKTLSFVPPDGRFTLGEYRYAPNTSSSRLARPQNTLSPTTSGINVDKDIVPLPFTLKASVELEEHGGMYSSKHYGTE